MKTIFSDTQISPQTRQKNKKNIYNDMSSLRGPYNKLLQAYVWVGLSLGCSIVSNVLESFRIEVFDGSMPACLVALITKDT